jgi:hypothetical protein
MCTLAEHEAESLKRFGKAFREVHLYMDQWHGKFGGHHRFMLHHEEGIAEVYKKFGPDAAEAARVHVIQDTTHVPKKDDYVNKKVDWLGYPDKVPYKIFDKREEL